ncbi:MAG TPA: ABC transporter permease [Kiritimatiellia bacterium]|jgi:ABC-type transport system involved in multi-copper enzyme maturation permease subunit|nr:ABC transporter permease [Kiritimatiellia bacterium]HOM58460.1 ABC transporter permease [Kiritimatiellia bacterium]HPC49117.1 ABC transporter permease [Kiritimatiellia bacterium]HPK37917.1 ABC transporter permease [Kiritimatiellia bacterium]HPW75773.1 ABC transporter permease [Kiritimatiellia bacterium]
MKMCGRQTGALVRVALLDLYRRKDLIVVWLLSLVLLLPLAFFSPFGISGAGRYLNEIALLLVWLFSAVIGVGVAARLFPAEFESRTIFPLLAKPVTRGRIVLGKYLGALAASVSALTVFYLAYGVLCGLRQSVWFPVVLFQAFLLHIGFLIVVTALAMLGSLMMTPSANLTLCGLLIVGMLVFGQRLPSLIAAQPYPGKAFLMLVHALGPHVEFFDLRQRVIHGWSRVGWDVCAVVLLYAIGYAAACLGLAGWLFCRKKV